MSATSFVISAKPQFNFRATVFSHGWLMLAPFSWDGENGRLGYVFQTDRGAAQRLLLSEAQAGVRVDLPDCQQLDPALKSELTRCVRRMLNMDWDLAPFYQAMRAHAGYEWLEAERCGRILIAPSLWENLAKVLLTTNCNWAQTINMTRRLCQLGPAHPELGGGHAFPAPGRIAELDFAELAAAVRGGYRNAYLHELARKAASGALDLDGWLQLDGEGFYRAVKSLKGFGDYAAATIVRLYGHFDRIAIDTACHAMFAALHNGGAKAGAADIQARYAIYGRWAGLVCWMDIMRHNSD